MIHKRRTLLKEGKRGQGQCSDSTRPSGKRVAQESRQDKGVGTGRSYHKGPQKEGEGFGLAREVTASVSQAPVAVRHSRRSLRAQEARWFYILISPWLIGFVWFTAFPTVVSLLLSFTHYDGYQPPQWTGFRNFAMLFTDPLFWQALKVTAYYAVVSIPLGIVLSLIFASMMNIRLRIMRLLRTVYYLPLVVPGVATALLWGWLFNQQWGLINYLLYVVFHIHGPDWLLSPTWVMPAIIITSLWTIGGTIIIYLAGLQGIPTELYEAAAVDGATRFRMFIRITIPMMTPVIFFTLILGLIGVFQVFTVPQVMTQGGPDYASFFYNLLLYQTAFHFFRLGYASAQAWVQLVLVMGLTYLLLRTSRSWVHYEGRLD